MFIVMPTKVVPASEAALIKFNRKDLRSYAKSLGVELGRNKKDTIKNLMASGKATLCASLGN